MTYVPHWRATFKGDFRASQGGAPYEQWSTSIAFNYGGAGAFSDQDGIANDLRDDFTRFIERGDSLTGATTYFTEVRLDSIGADGKINQDAIYSYVPGGGIASIIAAKLPPSCAMVLTLDTEVRGRSRFGRMYLPCLAAQPTATGGIAADVQGFLLASCKTLIEDLSDRTGLDVGFNVAVASGVGAGSLNPVKSIRMGRVIDTMRSRRRSMDENYAKVAVSV